MNKKLPLTESNLETAYQTVKELSNYGCEMHLIETFFNKYPLNTDPLIVAAKVAIIDTTNSTNIARYKSKISLCDVVKIILSINDIDKRIAHGDPSVVSEIARKSKKNHNINLFSFASKYCCYHNICVYKKDDYSIYDSVVSRALPLYATPTLPITTNRLEGWRKKFDYQSFNDYIGKILAAYHITLPYKRRWFDNFLWYNYK